MNDRKTRIVFSSIPLSLPRRQSYSFVFFDFEHDN